MYEKIHFGLELFLRLPRELFEQPVKCDFFNGLLAQHL